MSSKLCNSTDVEKTTKKITKKKQEQYASILEFMSDGEWHKTSEVAELLGLKETRTKELLGELVTLGKLDDDGKTKGKMYKVK